MSEKILKNFDFNEIVILEQEMQVDGHHLIERNEKNSNLWFDQDHYKLMTNPTKSLKIS